MNTAVGLCLLILSCIGNAELWVILVNRRHSLKYRHQTLKRIRHFHDVGLVCFPPFIVWLAGLREGGLLRGGEFGDLPRTVQWLIATTMVGFASFVLSVVRYQMRRPPHNYEFVSAHVHKNTVGAVDSSDDVLRTPVLSRLPLNQIRQLEVNTKRFHLSNHSSDSTQVPDLRLVHFTDVHLTGCPERQHYEFAVSRMLDFEPDAFLFTGDLLDEMALLPWAVDMFQRMADTAPCFFILGNHDWHLEHKEIRHRIEDTGWTNVGGATLKTSLSGLTVRVAGTEAPWIGENPVVPVRDTSTEDIRLLLSHAPDQRDFAVDNDFDLMVCGHNHGGQVVLPMVGPIYSPSRFGVRYAGGAFRHKSLLFHVSRGLGARDPLRWNCRPEVSLLEITK